MICMCRCGCNFECRKFLHKLLLGDGPLTFTPFPPSQLYQQLTETTESKPTEGTSFSDEDGEDEVEEKKWRPFPPPNVDSLLRRIPLTPMTLEELCAPSSDEEEDEREGRIAAEQVNSAIRKNEQSIIGKESQLLTCSIAAGSENVTDPCSSTHLLDHAMPPPITATRISFTDGRLHRKTTPPSTVSDAMNHHKVNRQSSVDSKPPARQFTSKHVQEKVPTGISVIDLTEQSVQQRSSTSHSNNSSTSRNLTSSDRPSLSTNNPHNSPLQKDPYELADDDDEDFDVLCLDIDLTTIDDFSDTEPEATGTVEPRIEQTSHSTTSGKGKSRASSTDEPIKTSTGLKRQNDFHDNSRSKQRRLETYGEHTDISSIASSGRTMDTDCVFPSNPGTSRGTKMPTGNESNTASVAPIASKSTPQGRISQGTVSNHISTMQNSRDGRKTSAGDTNPQRSNAPPMSRLEPVGIPTGDSGTVSGPSCHTSGTSSVGRVTPLGSRLTTDNCPMCNTRFPSWWVIVHSVICDL
jgi:hypothetical protein